MANVNAVLKRPSVRSHEGGTARQFSRVDELRRAVLTCMLWEETFYEKGSALADRMAALVAKTRPEDVAALAIEARDKMYLRHVPLFLVRELARIKGCGAVVAETLAHVIQRPDELTQYLAIYWKGQASGTVKRPEPLSAGSKRGLARAFTKFRPSTLAKYDRDGAVVLRDVLRLVHAKPTSAEMGETWKHVVARDLESPDTWEVALSAGKDKKATFERLLRDNQLGALAFLRNLRNMIESGVDDKLIRARFAQPLDKVLPFRYLAAVRYAPAYAQELSDAMLRAVEGESKLDGRTAVLVDVSGSMDDPLSAKSEMKRVDAAAGLAVLMREITTARVFSFSYHLVEVPNVRGIALAKAINDSQPHGGTALYASMREMRTKGEFDRIIVITDEQSGDHGTYAPVANGYVVNVAGYANGVETKNGWTRISGWSERIVDFIRATEATDR